MIFNADGAEAGGVWAPAETEHSKTPMSVLTIRRDAISVSFAVG
jgi:hypothetical protein